MAWGNNASLPGNLTFSPETLVAAWVGRAYVAYLVLVLVLGVLGNGMATLVYVALPRKNHGDWMLIALCVCDACVILSSVPEKLSQLTGRWSVDGSLGLCRMTRLLEGGFITASFLLLTFGAILAKYTITSNQLHPVSPVSVKASILVCFASGFATNFAVVFFVHLDEAGTCRFQNTASPIQKAFFAFYFFLVFSAIFTMGVFYSLILKYLRRHNREVAPQLGSVESQVRVIDVVPSTSQKKELGSEANQVRQTESVVPKVNQNKPVAPESVQNMPAVPVVSQNKQAPPTSHLGEPVRTMAIPKKPSLPRGDQTKLVTVASREDEPLMTMIRPFHTDLPFGNAEEPVTLTERQIAPSGAVADHTDSGVEVAGSSSTGLRELTRIQTRGLKPHLGRGKMASAEFMARVALEWDRVWQTPSTSSAPAMQSVEPRKNNGRGKSTISRRDVGEDFPTGLRPKPQNASPDGSQMCGQEQKTVISTPTKLDSKGPGASCAIPNKEEHVKNTRTETKPCGEKPLKIKIVNPPLPKSTLSEASAPENLLPVAELSSEMSSGSDVLSGFENSRACAVRVWGGQRSRNSRLQQERRLAVLFFTQTIIWFICWVPNLFLYLSWLANGNLNSKESSMNAMYLFFRSLHYISHTTNPLVYIIFNHKFRENSRKLPENISKMWLCRKVRDMT